MVGSKGQHLQQHRMPQCEIDFPHLATQPLPVHTAQLIQQDTRGFALELDFGAAAERLAIAGERGDEDARQNCVHVVWRHDQAGAGFLDFAADGGVEVDPINLAALCHTHSSSPLSTGMVSSTASSCSD